MQFAFGGGAPRLELGEVSLVLFGADGADVVSVWALVPRWAGAGCAARGDGHALPGGGMLQIQIMDYGWSKEGVGNKRRQF